MMPWSRVHVWLTQTAFRLMRFAPSVQEYSAQMKYKPNPFYRRGSSAGSNQGRSVGRMIARLAAETLDRLLVPLDQLLGAVFSLVAFGPHAEQWIGEPLTIDLLFEGIRRVAVFPSILNCRCPLLPGSEVARDLQGALSYPVPDGANFLMLVRPDRYIAAATCDATHDFAALLQPLVVRYVEGEHSSAFSPTAVPSALTSRRSFIRTGLTIPLYAALPTLHTLVQETSARPRSARPLRGDLPMNRSASPNPVIDAHSHYLPDFYVAAMKQAGMTHPDGFNIPDWSPDQAIATMDRHGIAAQILSISSPGLGFTDRKAAIDLARRCNEYAAQLIQDRSPRFGAVAVLPMPDVDSSLKEIEYALDVLKLDGIGLLSNYAGGYLGDPRFDAVFAELNWRKALVFVHPTSPPHFDSFSQGIAAPFLEFPFDTTRVAANLVKSGTMERNSDLRLILTHGGGTIPYIYRRLTAATGADAKRAFPAFHYDLVAATSPAQTGALASIITADHMILGFDFPFMNPQFIAPAMEALGAGMFTAEQLRDIRGRNALRLFPSLARHFVDYDERRARDGNAHCG